MSVGIVGGGITGLTAAYYLQKAGISTTVFEGEAVPGGLATAFDFGPFVWDKFYHCILTSDSHLLSLIEDLGLSSELRWSETKTGFFSSHGLHSMSNVREFLFFPPLSLWEKFRLGLGILYASRLKNPSRLENVPVADWLISVFGRGNYEKVWDPLLNCKLGACRKETSAAWIWATIFRYYSTRQTGQAKKEVLGYVRGGYRTVFRKLVERLEAAGTRFYLRTAVDRIEARPQGGVRIQAGVSAHDFDRVLFTGTSPLLAQLTPALDPGYARRLQAIRYLGVVCVALLLKRSLSRFYITNLIERNLPFTGIVEMTELISLEETAGTHLVYLPRYTAPDDAFFGLRDEDIWAQMKPGLMRVHPDLRDDEIEKVFVLRARTVQPVPVMGYSALLPPMKTNIPGLFLANTTFILNGTLNNNEMIKISRTAVDRILQSLPSQESAYSTTQITALPEFPDASGSVNSKGG
jgi:protoporphyrinogen oxidase